MSQRKKKKNNPPRPKRGGRYWTIVWLAAVLIGYPLSFGPACWWLSRQSIFSESLARDCVGFVYIPCGLAAIQVPVAGDALLWYASLGASESGHCIPIGWRRWVVKKIEPMT
jgi:hypothetical protein